MKTMRLFGKNKTSKESAPVETENEFGKQGSAIACRKNEVSEALKKFDPIEKMPVVSGQNWKDASFAEFARVLKGTDNINTAHFRGDGAERREYLLILFSKAGIDLSIVAPADRCQAYVALRGKEIYVEHLGPVATEGNVSTGAYQTWSISSNFSVKTGTKLYRKEHKL